MSEMDLIGRLESILETVAEAVDSLAENHRETAKQKIRSARARLTVLHMELGQTKKRQVDGARA